MQAYANTGHFAGGGGITYETWGSFSWDNAERYSPLGNFGNGGYNIDPGTITNANGLPGFDARNDQLVEIAVGLQNDCNGNGGYAGSETTLGNQPYDWEYSPSYYPPATTEYADNAIWPIYLSNLNPPGIPGCLCDGVVATDGMLVHGSDLEAWTANGPYSRTAYVQGYNSPAGCGNNSVYYMTWTVSREY
jgi:hypothetical protein